MAGHSKWATTKHKKAALDAKRGKLFARLVKNIEVAARTGGGDPAGNPTLYDAIQKAKKNSVPADNIDRAVKRGSGDEAGGADYETIMYEGYAPGGVAVLVECLTDNRNRAASDVRVAFTRNGGTLADPGSVAYLFNRRGVVLVPKTDGLSEDDVLAAVLDAGAEEVTDLGETLKVLSEATDVVAVRTALQDAGPDYDSAEAQCVRSMEVEVDLDGARKVVKLIDALEDLDDVQNVFANFDALDEVLAALAEDAPATGPVVGRPGRGVARHAPTWLWPGTRRAGRNLAQWPDERARHRRPRGQRLRRTPGGRPPRDSRPSRAARGPGGAVHRASGAGARRARRACC